MVHSAYIPFLLLLHTACSCQSDVSTTEVYVLSTSLASLQDGSECHPFLTLSQALNTIQALGDGKIILLADNLTYEEALQPVSRSIVLQGTNNGLSLTHTLHITKYGILRAEGLIVRGDITVEGLLVLANSQLKASQQGIRVNGGEVQLVDCVVQGWEERLVSLAEGVVSGENLTYMGNSGTFLDILSGDVFVNISNSSFEANSPAALITLLAPSLNASIAITHCSFRNNSGAIILSRASYLCFALTSSHICNSESGLILQGSAANLTVTNIIWENNSGPLLQVLLLKTLISVSGVTVREQGGACLLKVSSLGVLEDCALHLVKLDYRDTNYFDKGEVGVLVLRNCAGFLHHILLSNVNIGGYFGAFYAYFFLYGGFLELNSLIIDNSASNQALFYLVLSTAFISNLTITNTSTGLNSFLVAALCLNIAISDARLRHIQGTSTSDNLINAPSELVHIATQLSNVTITGLTVDSSLCKCMLFSFLGLVNITDLAVSNVSSKMGLMLLARAEGYARNAVIYGSMHALWGCASYSSLTVQNYTLISITMDIVIVCGTGSTCTLAEVVIRNSYAKLVLLTAHASAITLTHFSMSQVTSHCVFSIFRKPQPASTMQTSAIASWDWLLCTKDSSSSQMSSWQIRRQLARLLLLFWPLCSFRAW